MPQQKWIDKAVAWKILPPLGKPTSTLVYSRPYMSKAGRGENFGPWKFRGQEEPMNNIITFRPRVTRDTIRAQHAGEQAVAKAPRDKEMARALAQIATSFDKAAEINEFKQRIESYIRMGTGHPTVRSRFYGRAKLLFSYTIDEAILQVEIWRRRERLGLSLEVLRELRLLLRMIRRQKLRPHFTGILMFVLGTAQHP